MRQAPLRHDRAAARDDAGDAIGREVDVGQPHAGVDREVVDALFALLDQRIPVEIPGQLHGIAVALLQRLRSARCRSAPASCEESIHAWCGCCGPWRGRSRCRRPSGSPTPSRRLPLPPMSRPRRVADIGVDLGEEVAPMIIGSSSPWLMLEGMMARPRAIRFARIPRDEGRHLGAEAFAVARGLLPRVRAVACAPRSALGDVDHLLATIPARRIPERDLVAVEPAYGLVIAGKAFAACAVPTLPLSPARYRAASHSATPPRSSPRRCDGAGTRCRRRS